MEEVAVEVDDEVLELEEAKRRNNHLINGRLRGKKKGERAGGSGRIGDIIVMPNGRGRYH